MSPSLTDDVFRWRAASPRYAEAVPLAVPTAPGVRLAPLTRAQYDALVDAGAFAEGSRLELVEGVLVETVPEGPRHAAVVDADRDLAAHPTSAHLLVEVSRTSRALDLGSKAAAYAAAGVAAYWVVDLVDDVVHVHSAPTPDGYDRREVQPFDEPLEVLGLRVVPADLGAPLEPEA